MDKGGTIGYIIFNCTYTYNDNNGISHKRLVRLEGRG